MYTLYPVKVLACEDIADYTLESVPIVNFTISPPDSEEIKGKTLHQSKQFQKREASLSSVLSSGHFTRAITR
jgi:hypothetical protein